MKFLVDEMPYFRDECPFYETRDVCRCNCNYDSDCEYFKNDRDPECCNWLKEINEFYEKKNN